MVTLPRVMIAAPHSGGGKTTIATGLMAALARRFAVAPFKVGPDFIDPGFHALATGRPGRNLDAVLCGEDLITPLLLHGAEGADIAVVEGVMGLFDGQLGRSGFGSSAYIASLTGTPVVVVIDCAHASRSHAAVALGLRNFDERTRIAGVILNRVGSDRHAHEIESALAEHDIPVLGVLPRRNDLSIPARHVGLVTAEEFADARAHVERLADFVESGLDLEEIRRVAGTAPDLDGEPWRPQDLVEPADGNPIVAIAGGNAFTFCYPETVELLEAAGCHVTTFDPLVDDHLPDGARGIVIGGGFPELYASRLAANHALLDELAAFARSGGPVIAESAGALWLSRSLDGHPMAGVIPATAATSGRLSLGYRDVEALTDSVVARAGERLRGHEYHRTTLTPDEGLPAAWRIEDAAGTREEGASLALAGEPNVYASFLHLHWAAYPGIASRFAAAAARHEPGALRVTDRPAPTPEPDLRHHGDKDLRAGMIDFAVNVAVDEPPAWLRDAVVEGASRWAEYPDATPAREALAAHHGLDVRQVLPTAGAAEAFTLIARACSPQRAVVVHPQFTEPEQALATAGPTVERLILGPADGFAFNPHLVPRDADLVIIGNPTNPTGVLHPASTIEQLRQPGRIVVVDEAFIDLSDESQSLIGRDLTGVLVLRSLTKTYGVAGLRVGFVAGDASLIAELEAHQTPWSVSAPAVDATVACCQPEAAAHAERLREDLPERRLDLVTKLEALGLHVVASRAPFVLVDTSPVAGGSVREALAEQDIAVRRGESFPGLGPQWIRVAVRDADRHQRLADALARIMDHQKGPRCSKI